MTFIKESFIRENAANSILESSANRIMQKAASISSSAKTIFLSHSHHDKELAKGLKNYLANPK